MQCAERLLSSNVAFAAQPRRLKRLFGSFSSSYLALWGHPVGQKSVSPALIDPSEDLRQRAEQLVQNQSRPQLFRDHNSSFMITSRVMTLNGNPFRLYLLKNVSAEVAFQHQLNGLLLLAAVLVAVLSALLNRRGIDRALQPLTRLSYSLQAFQSNPLQHQAIEPDQLLMELKPLVEAVNELSDRLSDFLSVSNSSPAA